MQLSLECTECRENDHVAGTDMGKNKTWISDEGGGGHVKGEGTVYYPLHLISCRATEMWCLERRRRFRPNLGWVYACIHTPLMEMCLSVQLFNPLG